MASIKTTATDRAQLNLDFDAALPVPEDQRTSQQVASGGDVAPSGVAAQSTPARGGTSGPAATLLRAGSDWAAVETRIAAKADDADRDRAGRPSHTARAYRREARRFLLWLDAELGVTLATASLEDCLAYRTFLADPSPAPRWCAPRGPRIGTPEWRPFEGPLCATARRQAITILAGLYRFLQDQKYLCGNPWGGVSMPRNSQPRVNPTRRLTHAQWAAVERTLGMAPADDRARQLRWAVRFVYETGLRLAEFTAAQCGDLEWVELDDQNDLAPSDQGIGDGVPTAGAWVINVLGKGMKFRQVPVASHLIDELGELLGGSGGSNDPRQHAGRPLLVSIAPGQTAGQGHGTRLHGQTLYRQLKKLFAAVSADLARAGRQRDADLLLRASTHWLRHTYGAHAVAAGTAIDVVQRNLGHASLTSTTIYVDPELSRRVRESARLSLRAIQLRRAASPA